MNQVELYDEILSLLYSDTASKIVGLSEILKISDFTEVEINYALQFLKNTGYISDVSHHYDKEPKYTISEWGAITFSEGGFTNKFLEYPEVTDLTSTASLEEFDKEIELKKATEIDATLKYFLQRGDKMPLMHFNVHLQQYAFSKEWRDKIFNAFFLQNTGDNNVRITDRGKRLINKGGYTAMYYSKCNEENHQKNLKAKQEETIILNHKLSKANWDNYTWDRGKFYIPIAISLLALFASVAFGIWNNYK